ncbi:hypothetical protein BU16DRAFT_535994 [Lophium mytilinum]|uniref:Uncharacterized protein n=1 Tax=Lophium mytilinum TaxID=390894 RepID=A0A6A6R7F2_9PEZI|nr:hypothetical protein BU16DRAFT_535994 [Lophium mytilinum]
MGKFHIHLPLFYLSGGPEPTTKPLSPRTLRSHDKTTAMSSTTPTHRLLPRLALKDKAAIGIGVPLGLILILILGTMIWLNVKKRTTRGAVTEVDLDETELEAQKKAAANPTNNAQIRWKPY